MAMIFPFGPPTWFPSVELAEAFTILYSTFIMVEVLNHFIGRAKAGKKQDRGSYFVVIFGIIFSIAAAFSFRELGIGITAGWIQIAGLIMMAAGIMFREWAVFSLGRGFTVRVEIAKDHQLVTKGPYRWIRHPSYGGAMLTFVGVPLALGTWAGSIIILVVFLATYSYRVHVEERALISKFGDRYREYQKRTWKFLPGF